MLLPVHLVRDNRLRAAGFTLVAHLASGRRFWRVDGGFLPLDAEDADALIDLLVEADFIYVSPGQWRWEDGEIYRTIDAIDEVRRELLYMLKHDQGALTP